jgi:hypothetical protein
MARAVAKVSIHQKGGSANIEYIGRYQELSDLERAPELGISVSERLEEQATQPLLEMLKATSYGSAFAGTQDRDDDPIWTWNTPQFVTGDTYGIEESKQSQTNPEKGAQTSPVSPVRSSSQPERASRLSIDEKRENAISYFSVLAELEERKGGVTHFRIILTVGPEVTNRQIKAMVNAFLGENFSLATAMIAIHRDTGHTHVHIYVHARQLDNKRINLGQRYFKLDESWMKICSEHLRDSEIYDRHVALKRVTLDWKEQAEVARSKGEPIPPKDDRWSDHHETILRFQPWDDKWCGRLIAQTKVAEKRVEFLIVTKAAKEEIEAAKSEAVWRRERLETAAEKRRENARSEAKRLIPAEIITVSEAREMAMFERVIAQKSREIQQEVPSTVATPALRESQSVISKQGNLFDQSPSVQVSPSITEQGHYHKDESKPSIEIPKKATKKTKQRMRSSEQQMAFDLESDTSTVIAPNPATQSQSITTVIPPESTRVKPSGMLADDALSRLIVNAELAEVRATVLRAEEAQLNEIPHLWLSPSQDTCLRDIEALIRVNSRAENVESLAGSKEAIQQEIAVERIAVRERRSNAEIEAKDLQEHLSQEKAVREKLDLPMPHIEWMEEDILELATSAESARAPHLFKRIYEIERDRLLRDSQSDPDKIGLRLFEAKYIGLELKAEIELDRSEHALARAMQHPGKLLLPMVDGNGRDTAVSLEQMQPQKGIKGLFKRVTESSEDRQFRHRLEEAKDSYLNYLKKRCEANKAYHETACEIADECRKRSRELGFIRQAPPDVSSEELLRIEKYANQGTSERSGYWRSLCAEARILLELKANGGRVTPIVPDPPPQRYIVPKELQEARDRLNKEWQRNLEDKIRERKNTPTRPELVRLERDRSSRQRGGGGRQR